MSEEFATVYLPYPGNECHERNGARVELPSGETIPHVGSVSLEARGGEYVEVTVKMLARVETVED